MLEKQPVTDSIDTIRNGSLQIRKADLITEDGIEIAKTYHRYILHPGDDLAGQDPRIIAIANVVWTEEVIAAYLASLPDDPGEGGGDDEDPGEQ